MESVEGALAASMSGDMLGDPYESMQSMNIGVLIGGCFCLFLSCTLASAGGIGGGGLNVPILLVILGFKYQQCTILSLCTVLGNYMSQIYLNWDRSHPLMPSRPLIYFEIIIVLVPAQLGGNNIGVIVGEIFPDSILLILAMVTVIYALVKTIKKARKLYKKETLAIANYGDDSLKRPLAIQEQNLIIDSVFDDDEDGIDKADNPLLGSGALEAGTTGSGVGGSGDDTLRLDKYLSSTNLNAVAQQPHRNGHGNGVNMSMGHSSGVRLFDYSRDSFSSIIPRIVRDYYIIAGLFAVWVTYAATYVTMQVVAKPCSNEFYVLLTVSFIPLVVTVYFGLNYVRSNQIEDAHMVIEGDVDFSKLSFLPPIMAFVIGILCSLLGIGGGELMGPLLLSLGVLPLVSSATTSFMSFMSSSSNILHYAIQGKIDYKWALLCYFIGLLGGITGRSTALYLVARYKRGSITAFALAGILGVSILLLIYDIASSDFKLSLHNFCRT